MADPNESLRLPATDPPLPEVRAAKLAAFGILNSSAPPVERPIENPAPDPSQTKVTPIAHPVPVTPPDLEDAAPLATKRGYEILRKLGDGSYGDVYEARAPGGFRVAIKQLRRSAASNEGEIESLEAMKVMSHPFLVQMHAYWAEGGHLEIVMELAEGSLADRLEYHKAAGRPGVPPEELIPYFEQAADALDYLHTQKVSHRDVKPENLLLLKGYAKVADFGLAREHQHDTTQIATEQGTPMYMAPEVWARKVSLHSDQYGLAATYAVLRLGRRLFQGKNLFELSYQHANEMPDLAPLPLPEQQVLLKALSKQPDGRYPSCVEFARALRTAVLPSKATPRRMAWWVVAATLVIGIGVGLAGKFLDKPEPPAPVVPPPVKLWCPAGWEPVEDSGQTAGGIELHKRLTRTVATQRLVAILIVPRPAFTDPPTFYMLENKITRRVFQTAWDRAWDDKESELYRFRQDFPELLPGDWKKGKSLDDAPILDVTVPEAMLVAAALGGKLPTYQQWQKAVGAAGEDARPGPAGAKETPDEVLSKRPLALGLKDGPWSVAIRTDDVSVHGIHQLVSNGREWTDGGNEALRINHFARQEQPPQSRLTGRSWNASFVLTFERIHDDWMREEWHKRDVQAGFRIVLIPPTR